MSRGLDIANGLQRESTTAGVDRLDLVSGYLPRKSRGKAYILNQVTAVVSLFLFCGRYSGQEASEVPARVLLGSYGAATSSIKAPSPMNYLAVRLKAGERWRYQPPVGHTVLWTAIGMGSVLVPDELQQGELVAFTSSSKAVEFEATSDAEFVLGSAVPHRYDLVLGSHSVHTTTEALHEAEARISEIQTRLINEGKL